MGEIQVTLDKPSTVTPEIKAAAKKRMETARVQLLLTDQFFASVAMNLEVVMDEKVKGLSTNGKYVKYNPEYVLSMSLDQTIGLLLKVVGHVVLLHPFRKGVREGEQFDVAASHAVNLLLQKAGKKLPDDAIHDIQYEDMTVERIYDQLPENPKLPQQKKKAASGAGNVDGAKDIPGGESVDEQEADMKEKIAAAAQGAKQAGNLPAGLERLLSEIMEPKVNWRERLAAFISERDNTDYNSLRPNRRMLHTGFILPTLWNETVGKIILVVDTSGSISTQQLNCFGSELRSVASMFNKPIHVMYVDTEVAGEQIIEPDDDTPLQVAGYGGTCFRAPYAKIAKEGLEPKCLVYFTDGYCDSYPKDPGEFPTLWCLWGGMKAADFHPPFGEVLEIDELS